MSRVSQELWEAFCRKPNEESFLPLYQNTKALVFTICHRILQNAQDADDAFQGVYCRLLALAQRPEEAKSVEDIGEVVFRLAVRESDRRRKQRKRRNQREVMMENLINAQTDSLSPRQMAADRQIRERIETLIALLPEKYRVPILFHYFHGLTHREIARAMDKPINTISTNIRRGLKKLNPLMRRAGLGESLTLLGAFAAVGELISPPSALAGPVIFAKANAALAVGGATLAAGTTGASVGKILTGVGLMKAKLAVLTAVMAISVIGLIMIGLNQAANEPSNPAVISQTQQGKGDATQVGDSTQAELKEGNKALEASPEKAGEEEGRVVEISASPQEAEEDFSLTTLPIKVVWENTGKPVSQTSVTLQAQLQGRENWEELIATDEQGEGTLQFPLSSQRAIIEARHPEAEDLRLIVALPVAKLPYVMSLRKVTSIYGRVWIEEEGKLAAGAEVTVLGTDKTVTADDRGAFNINRVKGDEIRLMATLGQYRSFIDEQEIDSIKLIPNMANGPHNLYLKPGLTLAGIVRDLETGGALVGADISAKDFYPPGNKFQKYDAITDDTGAYLLAGLPLGRLIVLTSAERYVEVRKDIQLHPEFANRLDFELEVGGEIDVLVTDPQGIPIPGALIQLSELHETTVGEDEEQKTSDTATGYVTMVNLKGGMIKGGMISMQLPYEFDSTSPEKYLTNAAGRCSLKWVSLRNPPGVSATKEGYGRSDYASSSFPAGQRVAEVKLVLRSLEDLVRSGFFTGQVTDVDGNAIAGVEVQWNSRERLEHALTDELGCYFLEVKIQERNTPFNSLIAQGAGWFPATEINVQPGTAASPTEVNFVMEPAEHWLQGFVADEKGTPVEAVNVHVQQTFSDRNKTMMTDFIDGDQPSFSTSTDSYGCFFFADLPAGEIRLRLSKRGYTGYAESFAVDQEINIVLKPAGIIKGCVLDQETGLPISEFRVIMAFKPPTFEGGIFVSYNPGTFFSSPEGRFVLEDRDDGRTYNYTVEAEGYESLTKWDIPAKAPDLAKEIIFQLTRKNPPEH